MADAREARPWADGTSRFGRSSLRPGPNPGPRWNMTYSGGGLKVFFLGPGKTGTRTLANYAEDVGCKPCHLRCSVGRSGKEVKWAAAADSTWSKLRLPPAAWDGNQRKVLDAYCGFMDNGELADFRWLNAVYPHARFVLNTRGLKSYMVSRVDHMARHGHVLLNALRPDGVLKHALKVARVQQEALAFFNETAERRQRFAVVDVVGGGGEDLAAVLDWVMRKNLAEHPTSRLVTRPSELPARGSSSRHRKVAHIGTAKHSAQILSAVERTLHAGRCPQSSWDEILWAGLCGAGR